MIRYDDYDPFGHLSDNNYYCAHTGGGKAQTRRGQAEGGGGRAQSTRTFDYPFFIIITID